MPTLLAWQNSYPKVKTEDGNETQVTWAGLIKKSTGTKEFLPLPVMTSRDPVLAYPTDVTKAGHLCLLFGSARHFCTPWLSLLHLRMRIKTLLLSQDSSGKNHKNPQSNNNPTQLSLLPPLPSQATGIHSGGKAFPTSFCAQFSLGSIGIPPDEYLPFLSWPLLPRGAEVTCAHPFPSCYFKSSHSLECETLSWNCFLFSNFTATVLGQMHQFPVQELDLKTIIEETWISVLVFCWKWSGCCMVS